MVDALLNGAAAGDTRAAQALVRPIDQGCGRVGEAGETQDQSEQNLTREQRAMLIAALDRSTKDKALQMGTIASPY